MNAKIKQVAAVSSAGIIKTPNQPTYNLLFVEVTHSQNSGQPDTDLRVSIAIAIINSAVCIKYQLLKTKALTLVYINHSVKRR